MRLEDKRLLDVVRQVGAVNETVGVFIHLFNLLPVAMCSSPGDVTRMIHFDAGTLRDWISFSDILTKPVGYSRNGDLNVAQIVGCTRYRQSRMQSYSFTMK